MIFSKIQYLLLLQKNLNKQLLLMKNLNAELLFKASKDGFTRDNLLLSKSTKVQLPV
jgi:hypothetical protein